MRIQGGWRWFPAALLIAVTGMVLTPGSGWGHAAPVGLEPPHAALMEQSPAALRLQLTQPVELGFSQVSVKAGRHEVGGAGALQLEGDRIVVQPLPPLAPGRYDVSWRVLSIDGHVTQGSYHFFVLGAADAAGEGKDDMSKATTSTFGVAAGLYGGAALAVGTLVLLMGSRRWRSSGPDRC